MKEGGNYFVYVMANWDDSVIYVGVTGNLIRRVHQHKNGVSKGFTQKYNVHKLVYFEETASVISAIGREKEIKGWRRDKKNQLVFSLNPEWRDLSEDWR